MEKMEMLDNYLDGLMSVEEMRKFESLMAGDEELAREYRLNQDLSRAILNEKTKDFRMMLDAAHRKFEKKDKRVLYYKMTAAIAVFLTLGGILLLLLNRPSPSRDLADKYYQSYQPLNGVRSADPRQDALIGEAFAAYHKGDYFTASRHFEALLKDDPGNNQARFYLAISYMENKQEASAIGLLQQIIDSRDVYYLSQSEWYLGICYLWMGRKEEAILPFERLAKKKGYYQDQARKVLEEINGKS